MKDYFYGFTPDSFNKKLLLDKVYQWFGAVCLAVLIVLAVMWTTKAYAETLFLAEAEGVKIALTDQPCKLAAISNLKFEALWTENGKTFKGCYGGHPALPVVVLYFEDKTVVVLPAEMFVKVVGV